MESDFNNEETFRQIAWESQTLYERVAIAEDISCSPDRQSSYPDFLSEWVDAVGHDQGIFEDVFRAETGIMDDLKDNVERVLAIEMWPQEVELPPWIAELEQLVAFATSQRPNLCRPSEEPFYHVIDAWVSFALDELRSRITPRRLSDDALLSAASWLTERLQEFCLEPLYVSFRTYGLMHTPSRFLCESEGSSDRDTSPSDTYDAFVRKLHTDDGLWSFFTEFPVLARFLTTTIRQWLGALTEFHERLESDWDALIEYVSSEEPRRIDDLEVLTKDRHHDGQSVIEVTVSDGETIIYKPRSVRSERVWYELVEHVFEMLQLDYESPSIIRSCENYGWVQKVPHTECENNSQIERYFERTGVLLGLSYVLYFNDLHFENFVANGEYPVIVDAETLLQPATQPQHRDQVLHEEIGESVVWTGYLPVKRLEDRDTMTAAGLASPPFDDVQRPGIKWNNVNTDYMDYEEGSGEASDSPKHLPLLSGTMQSPREHIREILVGFNSVMNILQHEEISLVSSEIDSALDDLNQRHIFRDTMLYEMILNKMIDVDSLEDGLELTTSCDKLLINDPIEDYGIFLDIYASELTSLLRLDVPHFTINSEDEVVDSANNRTSGLIDRSGYERFSRRRQHIRPTNVKKQVEYIQATLSPTTPPQRTITESMLRDEILPP